MELALFAMGMILLGTGVGVVSAALGVGGGILMVPAFVVFIDGMDMNTAKGSSLFIIVFVAAYNSWRMNRGDMRSPWDVVFLVGIGSITGAYLGGWVTTLMSETVVTAIFIVLLGIAGLRTFYLQPQDVREEDVRTRRGLSILIGVAAGIASGATGTGGGAVLVPLVLWAGIVSNERVVALSNTIMAATCFAGAAAHFFAERTFEGGWTFGLVAVSMAPLVFVGAVAGAPIGRRINAQLDLRRRRVVMALLLLVIVGRLSYRIISS